MKKYLVSLIISAFFVNSYCKGQGVISCSDTAPVFAKITFLETLELSAPAKDFNAEEAFAEFPYSRKAIAKFARSKDFQTFIRFETRRISNTPFHVSVYSTSDCVSIREIAQETSTRSMNIDEFSQILAGLLSSQSNGQPGKLLTSPKGNLFFVEAWTGMNVAVLVVWNSHLNRWCFYCKQMEFEWDPGIHVFLYNDQGI